MSRSVYIARWIVPVDAQPIENGRVVVEDGVIVEVGAVPRGTGQDAETRDFGDAVILPGFVNAHTHLEYTAQRGFLEDVPFFPWIRELTASKSQVDLGGWVWSARLGALESIAAGITTVGDNTDAGVTVQVTSESGLRAVVFQEVFGIDDHESPAMIVDALRQKVESHRRYANDRVRLGISPHALYTVRPALFAALNANETMTALPWSIHIAESPAESLLTETGTGPFAEMFQQRGIAWESPHVSPTAYAAQVGALGPDTIAVHCVHQTDKDILRLRDSGAAVVHCPKSNAKLGAGIAPLAKWLRCEDLRVGLGTDSAVSNNTLDMFEEMRAALLNQRAVTSDIDSVTAHDVLYLATLGSAGVLQMDNEIGSLTPGKRADLIAVRLDRPHTQPASDPYAALIYSARADDVVFTLCDGVVLYDNGDWPTLNAPAILDNAREVRRALDASRGA